ncbi:MAG: hypothetical protein ACKVP0_06760 [Pirellulaceae bacterium]
MSDNIRLPIILSVHRRGVPEFERYVISDQFLRVWTGAGWDSSETKAMLFDDTNSACEVIQQLLMIEFDGRPLRRFRAPVYVDLYANEPVSIREIQAWLVRVSRLLIDSPRHGNGPMQGTLGLTRIEWGELEELPPKEMK